MFPSLLIGRPTFRIEGGKLKSRQIRDWRLARKYGVAGQDNLRRQNVEKCLHSAFSMVAR
jgi:hypothetical protein